MIISQETTVIMPHRKRRYSIKDVKGLGQDELSDILTGTSMSDIKLFGVMRLRSGFFDLAKQTWKKTVNSDETYAYS